MRRRRAQRGVALLTALLVVALVAILGVGMLTRMNFALHRGGNFWLSQQALQYAVGVEAWVAEILRRDREDNKIDSLDEAWAQPANYLPIEAGVLSGGVSDLQGRFNLNNLAGAGAADALAQFARLIQIAAEADPVTAQAIAQAARDWVDADIRPTLPNGAEDSYYLGLDPAYRAANRPLTSVSGLRAVRGVDTALYAALAPHLSALPETTPINVNTATAPVLASLAEGLDLAIAKALIEKRKETPWDSVAAFLQEPELAGREIAAAGLSVASGYFLAAGQVSLGRVRLPFFSLLQRSDNGQTRIIRHSRNAL